MTLPYRTRRALRGLAVAALVFLLLLIVVWLVWLLWLDRYVVYTRDGAILDFSLSNQQLSGEVAIPPENDITVSIYYNEGDSTLNMSTDLVPVTGYYVDREMLMGGVSDVIKRLQKLPSQTPVLIEVKDIVGRFFYTTSLGPVHSGIDTESMEELFDYLSMSDLYTIAKAPALRDYYYGLNNVSHGLPIAGGYLWMEPETNCYWLNPASEGTISYLMQIALELKGKGFDEVVFSDFRFPDTNKIVFNGSKTETLNTTAQRLLDTCGTERFAISFCVKDTSFTLPNGRTRMYFEDAAASDARTIAEETGMEDNAAKLVFITDLNDTRFDSYGVLRPLSSAELDE